MILKLKNIEKLCFIGYKDDEYKIKPLCIILPKTSAYKNMVLELNACLL